MGIECGETPSFLIITQIATFVLFVFSEILGSSKCQYNGVFELVVGGCSCLGNRNAVIRVSSHEHEILQRNP